MIKRFRAKPEVSPISGNSCRLRLPALVVRLAVDRAGATLVEFALIAMPFMLLLLATFEGTV